MSLKHKSGQEFMTSRARALRALALAAASLFFAADAPAGDGKATGGSDHVEVSLVAEHATIRPGEPFDVGLHMKMKSGWHTYWKQPGDAGLPPHVQWTLPAGFTAGPIQWPVPERISEGQLMCYAYGKHVLLLVTITPPAVVEAESVKIAAEFEWLECKDVCIAGVDLFRITIPVRAEEAGLGSAAPLFAEARRRMPRTPTGWSVVAKTGPRAIELSLRPPPGLNPRGAYFFIDQPLVVSHAAPQGFERLRDGFRLTMVPADNAPSPPRRITGVLTLDGISRRDGNAVAIDVEATAGDPAPAPPQKRGRFSVAVYAILLGLVGLGLFVLRRRLAARI